MTANPRLNKLLGVGCFFILILWLYFLLFVLSRDSGRTTATTEIDGVKHTETHYDNAQRFRPYAPLVILGIYGGAVGGFVSFLARRKTPNERLLKALLVSPIVAALSAVIVLGFVIFSNPANLHPPDMSPAQRILPALGVTLIYSPGVCIFAGIPAILGGLAFACLLPENNALPIAAHTPPPLPKANGE